MILPLFSKLWTRGLLLLGTLAIFYGSADATVTVPSIISDHAVFQKSDKTRIWGKAAPAEHVKVTLGTAHGETDADASGLWHIDLDLSKSPEGPFDLAIEGTNKIVVADVLIGEVWVCSGQSNMERRLDQTAGWEQEVAQSSNNRLRQFHVGSKTKEGLQPMDDCGGKWEIASPMTTPGFTAVGYYFAKKLMPTLNEPFGLVNSSVGGTPAEEWMSPESAAQDPRLTPTRDKYLAQIAADPGIRQAYIAATHDWEMKNNRADQATPDPSVYAGVDVATTDWKPVTLLGKLSDAGLPDSGVFWFRKKVTVPPNVGNQVWIDVVNPGGFETIFWNGKQIVSVTPETMQPFGGARRYYVAPPMMHEGENVIAIRLFSPMGGAGFTGDVKRFVAGPIPLEGEWLAKVQVAFPPIDPALAKTYPEDPHAPPPATSRLYNGFIAPIINETIRGVLWYQGEANGARAYQYRTTFPELITGWRAKWGWDMPFYFCQLANFMAKKNVPDESPWAELREAQSKTLSLPKTGQAVLIDIGEEGDIHPRDKIDVGNRLALIALAHDYGQNSLEYSGPVYDSMTVEGNNIRLKFTHVGGGLVAKPVPAEYKVKSADPTAIPLVRNSPNSELEGFAICGDDHKWAWADAKIDGDSVLVSSPAVPKPVAVRYAWADNPTCNLYNKAGLPASPFRTDDFPEKTAAASY